MSASYPQNPVALITGAGAPRIGNCVARVLGEKGYQLAIHANASTEQADATVAELEAKGISAMTVNRWAHGYSYSPGLLWEPHYDSESDKPWVKGRQPHGRIGIANSDAGAAADTDSAIYHGHRAVQEILGIR